LFLINPKSGVMGKRNLPRLIEENIDRDRYDYKIEFTQFAGHASELAAAAADRGVNVVVAVGGDGTVNEVARSLVHTKTALGVLPCGSGNGFARHLGIPVDLRKAVEFINNAEPVAIDYGKLNGKPFFCACGLGFDALVSADFANGEHRGMFGYVQKTLVDWVRYEPEVYELEADSGKKSYRAFLIACGNASQYGNNAYITPFASMRGGMLSVSILEPFTSIEVPMVVAQLFSNTLNDNSRMTTFTTRKVLIKRKSPGPVHYDGEPYMMDRELLVEVVPGGLNVLALPGWDGTCVPVPLYRQIREVMEGAVAELPAFPSFPSFNSKWWIIGK
jgi:YegS/Rv2252/BmrU family lipid kinase